MLDIVIVLVMSVPMLLFAVYPGLKAGDFLEKKYNLDEDKKKIVTIVVTVVFAISLSLFLHFF
ncbi:MAG: hypothetical protein WC144_04255 [Sulfurimonas sp.]|jgi:hypothetical protein|nr:hypothetical protein [Sulfurimonadaceae bacterium]